MSSSCSSISGLSFKLHPLAILNISDHYARMKAQCSDGGGSVNSGRPQPRVVGCVIGEHSGRTVEIFNSFELVLDPNSRTFDRGLLETKQEQYKRVFPKFDILGWYSTGSDVQDGDLQIHRALMDINESPIYLLLNPVINPPRKDVPVSLFESEVHVIDGVPSLTFVKSSYTVETLEAERITVENVAQVKPLDGSSGTSGLDIQLARVYSAIGMLNSRLKVLHRILTCIQKGEVPNEHSILRRVASLLRRLPAINSSKFEDEFILECNDTLLMVYLSALTKCSAATNEFLEKFHTAFDKQTRRGWGATWGATFA